MVAAPCPCHGRSDFIGDFAQSIVDGKLVPQSPYAGRLSDGAYNLPLENPKNRRYPRSGEQFAAMYSCYGYAAPSPPPCMPCTACASARATARATARASARASFSPRGVTSTVMNECRLQL